jgi:hypothetical protein
MIVAVFMRIAMLGSIVEWKKTGLLTLPVQNRKTFMRSVMMTLSVKITSSVGTQARSSERLIQPKFALTCTVKMWVRHLDGTRVIFRRPKISIEMACIARQALHTLSVNLRADAQVLKRWSRVDRYLRHHSRANHQILMKNANYILRSMMMTKMMWILWVM